VAVHPGVGNVMRQWPAEHFASLIDLLVEKNAVNAVLIGGPEEVELAEEVLNRIANRDAVVSLVGKTPLRQLPDLLRACALYVGNNSGPKHIAAALGVPTIGIHSGVVDAIEWGPIGGRAVAVRRNMSCSPCYLARLEDCPRSFACMRGLEPIAVQEVAEILLARPVERQVAGPLAKPEPRTAAPPESVKAQPKPRRGRRRQVTSASAG
jgi:O-antigen biosynthesis protein